MTADLASLTVQELAAGAAEYIREHGWTQARLQDRSGCACLLGACAAVVFDGPQPSEGVDLAFGIVGVNDDDTYAYHADYYPLLQELAKHLPAHDLPGWMTNQPAQDQLWRWNDRVARREDEVLAFLDAVAAS